MIDITDATEKCFASYGRTGCKVYAFKADCKKCAFYKPKNCEDWIRCKDGDRVYLYEPEEWEDLKNEILSR